MSSRLLSDYVTDQRLLSKIQFDQKRKSKNKCNKIAWITCITCSTVCVIVGVIALVLGILINQGVLHNYCVMKWTLEDPNIDSVSAFYELLNFLNSTKGYQLRYDLVGFTYSNLTLQATHTTNIWHFIDDIVISVLQSNNGPVVSKAKSTSRIGDYDLGQNKRNLHGIISNIGLKYNETIIEGC